MTVAFIGHRNVWTTDELRDRLKSTLIQLIEGESADIFLFGSASSFDKLCYNVVTELKQKYSHIVRVCVRAEDEFVDESYIEEMTMSYDHSFFPMRVHGAGRMSYIRRNEAMIDDCDVLIVYCNDNYEPKRGKSGTKMAVNYAEQKHKRVINLHK